MGVIKAQPTVKLVIGFIYREANHFKKAKQLLARHFGQIDFSSPEIAFAYTDYYQEEFGKDLKRSFISFKKLILAQDLCWIKTLTNQIENKLAVQGRRTVNIDPGYLDLAKLVLATTKDFNHRIYLDRGIFAEVTLFFQGNTFRHWKWTYPDYRTPEYIEIFNQIREIYKQQICIHPT